MFNQSAHLNVMIKAIEKATHHWRHDLLELEQLQMAGRSVSEFVTKSYTKTASLLKQELTKAKPKYGFISQDVTELRDDPYCWMIEPLDGIHNFSRALPYAASSIALLRDKKPCACVIYTPLQQQLFWAEQGGGAFSQARRLRVSQRKEQRDLIVGANLNQTSWRYRDDHPDLYWRDWGCSTLSMVYTAMGSLDAFIADDSAITPALKAVGAILIKEAGGLASDFQGRALKFPAQDIILTSELTQKTLLPIISDYLDVNMP